NEAQPVSVFCLNSRLRSGSEEPLDSFVSKPLDRHAFKCNLYGYRPQPAARQSRRWRCGTTCARRKRGGWPGMLPAGDGFAEFDGFPGFLGFVSGVLMVSFASGWVSKMGS